MSFDELRVLAAQQRGLFTTAQAEALGVPRIKVHRLAQSGTVRQVRRSIYSVELFQSDHLEEVRAAWLSLDPSKTGAQRLRDEECAVVATTSAAYVYGIGNFTTYAHEFFSPKRKQSRAEDIRIRVRKIPPSDLDIVEGLRVTTVTRTVLDLLADGEELEHIGDLLVDAVAHHLTVKWGQIYREVHRLEKTYGMSGSKIFRALSTAASDAENQVAVAQAIMSSSFPKLYEQISKQWSEALPSILSNIGCNLPPTIPSPDTRAGLDTRLQ